MNVECYAFKSKCEMKTSSDTQTKFIPIRSLLQELLEIEFIKKENKFRSKEGCSRKLVGKETEQSVNKNT